MQSPLTMVASHFTSNYATLSSPTNLEECAHLMKQLQLVNQNSQSSASWTFGVQGPRFKTPLWRKIARFKQRTTKQLVFAGCSQCHSRLYLFALRKTVL